VINSQKTDLGIEKVGTSRHWLIAEFGIQFIGERSELRSKGYRFPCRNIADAE
jgi:hypothetical protein